MHGNILRDNIVLLSRLLGWCLRFIIFVGKRPFYIESKPEQETKVVNDWC